MFIFPILQKKYWTLSLLLLVDLLLLIYLRLYVDNSYGSLNYHQSKNFLSFSLLNSDKFYTAFGDHLNSNNYYYHNSQKSDNYWGAIQKRSHEHVQRHYKKEAKRFRLKTFIIPNLEEQFFYVEKKTKVQYCYNGAIMGKCTKIVSNFGCTNIFFVNVPTKSCSSKVLFGSIP